MTNEQKAALEWANRQQPTSFAGGCARELAGLVTELLEEKESGECIQRETPTFGSWISVKDKLPEDCPQLHFYDDGCMRFTTVMTIDHGRHVLSNRILIKITGIRYIDEQNKQHGWLNHWTWSSDCGEPTHWMPLPELPKSREGGREDG